MSRQRATVTRHPENDAPVSNVHAFRRGERMRSWPVVLVIAILLAACAGDSALKRQFERYKALAAAPTPEGWKDGAVWTFVTTKRDGTEIALTFRISNAAADTCTSGDWRSLEPLDAYPGSLAEIPFKPASRVDGRNLWISLRSNWCDMNHDLKGELSGNTFNGRYTSGGISGEVLVGHVRGWRTEQE